MKTFGLVWAALMLLVWAVQMPTLVRADATELYELRDKVKALLVELREFVEQLYLSGCDEDTMIRCVGANYQACDSAFPGEGCTNHPDYQNDRCTLCGGTRWSLNTTTIRLAANTTEALADMCRVLPLDDYFRRKYESESQHWKSRWGIDFPWMMFGSSNGMFKIYPARPTESCSGYDCRLRPFYVAAGSGPKDLIVIMDVSWSMTGLPLSYLKVAAGRIIDSLTIGDRVALVPFSDYAIDMAINGTALLEVSDDVKETLKAKVNALAVDNSTNFDAAFRRAFEIMDQGAKDNHPNCNTAIVFFTDGKMTESPPQVTKGTVKELFREGTQRLEGKLGRPISTFWYTISEDEDVHRFPKELSCMNETTAFWARIPKVEAIPEKLANYYQRFAMGLGDGNNQDFLALTDVYTFATNGEEGITFSLPVYDRSTIPPTFVGVVALDLLLKALKRALGGEFTRSDLRRLLDQSIAHCPSVNSSPCMDEFYRSMAGAEAMCGVTECDADGFTWRNQSCPDAVKYASIDLFENHKHQYSNQENRFCCSMREESAGGTCPVLPLFHFEVNSDSEKASNVGASGLDSAGTTASSSTSVTNPTAPPIITQPWFVAVIATVLTSCVGGLAGYVIVKCKMQNNFHFYCPRIAHSVPPITNPPPPHNPDHDLQHGANNAPPNVLGGNDGRVEGIAEENARNEENAGNDNAHFVNREDNEELGEDAEENAGNDNAGNEGVPLAAAILFHEPEEEVVAFPV